MRTKIACIEVQWLQEILSKSLKKTGFQLDPKFVVFLCFSFHSIKY